MRIKPFRIGILGLLWCGISSAGADISGQLSLWGSGISAAEKGVGSLGLRYLPEYTWNWPLAAAADLDLDISWNISGLASVGTDTNYRQGKGKPYRLWVRYTTRRFEFRLGMQKITFGPARLFRSLMWFDRLDPRDPTRLTEGVYGGRWRYDFPNNSSLWGWLLIGNTGTKGLEILETCRGYPEPGLRSQIPLGRGEVAITAHRRFVARVVNSGENGLVLGDPVPENRVAVDGIWDLGPGVWFETALIQADHGSAYPDWNSFLTLGADYTLGYGNGITVTAEHFLVAAGSGPYDAENHQNWTALMLTYPLGIMDQLTWFGIYDWEIRDPYQYISWQRTFTEWILHISGFWSPASQTFQSAQFPPYSGLRGIQITVIINH